MDKKKYYCGRKVTTEKGTMKRRNTLMLSSGWSILLVVKMLGFTLD
jgi:hypothetical protein